MNLLIYYVYNNTYYYYIFIDYFKKNLINYYLKL